MSEFRPHRSILTSRQISLLIETYRKWLPLLMISGISFFIWIFVIFFVPPVIAADLVWKQAYLPFYFPLFLSVLCVSTFCFRHVRRGIFTALFILCFFILNQLRIFQWWQAPLLALFFVGTEYLLTHR